MYCLPVESTPKVTSDTLGVKLASEGVSSPALRQAKNARVMQAQVAKVSRSQGRILMMSTKILKVRGVFVLGGGA